MPLKLMIIAKKSFHIKIFLFMVFFHFLHNYKRKNKSPKILIIFPFCFVFVFVFLGPNAHFPLNLLTCGSFYTIKSFKWKTGVSKEKDGSLKGYKEWSEQRMMGKWFQSLIISLSLDSLALHPSPTPSYTIFKIKKKA